MSNVAAEPLTIPADDGCPLSGLVLRPPAPDHAVLVSSGTGFPKEFYRRFGRWLAARGAVVLLYDYRGIGGSAPSSLRGFEMRYADWGRLDMPAALDALAAAAPGLPIGHVGHSVGGHFVGFMRNHALIQRHAFVSVGTGTWWKHHRTYNPLELWFWWGLGPLSLARHGYLARGGGWSGAALPRGVFVDWRRWCHRHDYFAAELATTLRPHAFADVRAPIRSWIFPDDPIANRTTGPELLACYPAAPSEIVLRRPEDVGVRRIGHEGAFRGGLEPLWTELRDWLVEGRRSADDPARAP